MSAVDKVINPAPEAGLSEDEFAEMTAAHSGPGYLRDDLSYAMYCCHECDEPVPCRTARLLARVEVAEDERNEALAKVARVSLLASVAVETHQDLHTPSASTAGCYGGIGGQMFTAHCGITCDHPKHLAAVDRWERVLAALSRLQSGDPEWDAVLSDTLDRPVVVDVLAETLEATQASAVPVRAVVASLIAGGLTRDEALAQLQAAVETGHIRMNERFSLVLGSPKQMDKKARGCFSCHHEPTHQSQNGRVLVCEYHFSMLPSTNKYKLIQT